MDLGITEYEIEILDKIIPTQTFGNPSGLKMAIRNLLMGQREGFIANGMTDKEFSQLLSQTGTNVFQFLRKNEFYYEREGEVYYLTEKGKQLRNQGTLMKYIEWREAQRAKNASDMKEIVNKGFIEDNQPDIVVRDLEKKRNKFRLF